MSGLGIDILRSLAESDAASGLFGRATALSKNPSFFHPFDTLHSYTTLAKAGLCLEESFIPPNLLAWYKLLKMAGVSRPGGIMLENAQAKLEESIALLERIARSQSKSAEVLQAALITDASLMIEGLMGENPRRFCNMKAASRQQGSKTSAWQTAQP